MGILVGFFGLAEITLGIVAGAIALTAGTDIQLIIAVLLIGFGLSHLGIGWLIAMGADWMKVARSKG